ncbi:MAG: alpha/beta hydrolase family protein [Candidatus Saccharimonadales bacterium]
MIKQISIPVTGYSIQADWHEGEKNRGIILTFVGFGSSKKSNSDFVAKVVADTGLSALIVDFSGHGESPLNVNETIPAQHLFEATKAYDWIKANYPDSAVHVMGTSYGGFMAAYLTRFRAVQKLILRTPAIYEPKDFYTQHQYIDKLQVREYRKNTETLKKHPLFLQESIGQPLTLLVVHGEDKSVPTDTTDIYKVEFAAETYIAEGFAHPFRDPSNPQDGIAKYYEVITDWLLK